MNMTDRTLSLLLVSATLIVFLGFFLFPSGPQFAEVPKFIRVGYVFFFGAAPLLLMMKLISKLFPSAFKQESLSLNEMMFGICYVFLSSEARSEWRGYINEKRNRESA